MKSLTLILPSGSLVSDIVIDQSAPGALQEFGVQTEGVVRADNVTIKGYAPAKPDPDAGDSGGVDSMFSPIARTESAVVRATNFTAVGGTAAGTHDEADLPPDSLENTLDAPLGIWVGQSTRGTIQLVNPTLSGWSNGIYGGRTTGRVEVRGGSFVNNFNCQTRIGGGSIVDGAEMLLDDRKWTDKGPFKIGHQGVYAARVDAKHGNTTDPAQFVNLRVVANSMREGASLFDWESVSGPGIVRNSHITNHLDRVVFLGESPSVSGPTNIMVDQCLIDGTSSAGVMQCHDRPQSRIQRTCITTPDAGPEDIKGAQIGQAVSFGQCTSGSGLSAPKKVGNPGNISSLPAPSYNGSKGTFSRSTPSKKAVGAGAGGMFAAIFGGFVGGLGMLFIMIFIIPTALLFLSLWQILGD